MTVWDVIFPDEEQTNPFARVAVQAWLYLVGLAIISGAVALVVFAFVVQSWIDWLLRQL